jgi:hypothetical protein
MSVDGKREERYQFRGTEVNSAQSMKPFTCTSPYERRMDYDGELIKLIGRDVGGLYARLSLRRSGLK